MIFGVDLLIHHGVDFGLDAPSYFGGNDTLLSQILLPQLELLFLWCWIIAGEGRRVEQEVVSIVGVRLLHSLKDLLALDDVWRQWPLLAHQNLILLHRHQS